MSDRRSRAWSDASRTAAPVLSAASRTAALVPFAASWTAEAVPLAASRTEAAAPFVLSFATSTGSKSSRLILERVLRMAMPDPLSLRVFRHHAPGRISGARPRTSASVEHVAGYRSGDPANRANRIAAPAGTSRSASSDGRWVLTIEKATL